MTEAAGGEWQSFDARITRGHGVASGRAGDARFPGGTVRMQTPHFLARGLDLSPYFPGTINVGIAPRRYRIIRPKHTFENVRWHPTQPAETFSFFDVRLIRDGEPDVNGLIYYPHPETKPEHFQSPDVLELLLPFVDGLASASDVRLAVLGEQIVIE